MCQTNIVIFFMGEFTKSSFFNMFAAFFAALCGAARALAAITATTAVLPGAYERVNAPKNYKRRNDIEYPPHTMRSFVLSSHSGLL